MRPHADNLNGFFFREYLIHQTVLDVYTAGVKTVHIARQLFIRQRVLERVFGYKVYQFFCPFIQICGFQQRDVLCGSLCINNGIHYHSTSEAGIHSDNGVTVFGVYIYDVVVFNRLIDVIENILSEIRNVRICHTVHLLFYYMYIIAYNSKSVKKGFLNCLQIFNYLKK